MTGCGGYAGGILSSRRRNTNSMYPAPSLMDRLRDLPSSIANSAMSHVSLYAVDRVFDSIQATSVSEYIDALDNLLDKPMQVIDAIASSSSNGDGLTNSVRKEINRVLAIERVVRLPWKYDQRAWTIVKTKLQDCLQEDDSPVFFEKYLAGLEIKGDIVLKQYSLLANVAGAFNLKSVQKVAKKYQDNLQTLDVVLSEIAEIATMPGIKAADNVAKALDGVFPLHVINLYSGVVQKAVIDLFKTSVFNMKPSSFDLGFTLSSAPIHNLAFNFEKYDTVLAMFMQTVGHAVIYDGKEAGFKVANALNQNSVDELVGLYHDIDSHPISLTGNSFNPIEVVANIAYKAQDEALVGKAAEFYKDLVYDSYAHTLFDVGFILSKAVDALEGDVEAMGHILDAALYAKETDGNRYMLRVLEEVDVEICAKNKGDMTLDDLKESLFDFAIDFS
ncbi:hypothetical protein HOC35_07285 [Candidatus Woesearchaeota archaeon]|jgi:hypothetical protein|nr:hypothetical protein [Candidatus Woesearchaeota archaeon]